MMCDVLCVCVYTYNPLIQVQLVLSKETFSKAVQDCATTIKNTNSNIARLNRTQQHSAYADYLKVSSTRLTHAVYT